MSTLKSSAEDLTLNADGSGNDIKFQSDAVEVAAIDQAGNLTVSGTVDGVDIQTLNTTASAALPKAGGTMTGTIIIDQDTDNIALKLDSEATTKETIDAYGKQVLFCQQDIAGGYGGYFYRNINEAGSNPLVRIREDNVSNTQTALWVQQDGSGLCADFIGDKIRVADGILFGTDTAAANALDDYEEGTWTPGFNGGAAPEASAASATYVKVGTMVTCYLMWWGFTGSAVAAQITGCPFTSKAGTYVTGTLGANTWTTNGAGCWGYTAATIRIQDCVNLNEATGIVGYPKYISMAITYQTT